MNIDEKMMLYAARRFPDRKWESVVNDAREKLEKQRKMRTMIRQNVCPICGSKLSRGKKDKKNGYKRKWTCTECSNIYTI